jgi:hypothetical protein
MSAMCCHSAAKPPKKVASKGSLCGNGEIAKHRHTTQGAPMKSFLHAFALSVAGVLQGFDRLVFRGRLPILYAPNGMDFYLAANHVLRKEFKRHAFEVTGKVLGASLVARAKELGFEQHQQRKSGAEHRGGTQGAGRPGVCAPMRRIVLDL